MAAKTKLCCLEIFKSLRNLGFENEKCQIATTPDSLQLRLELHMDIHNQDGSPAADTKLMANKARKNQVI